MQQTRRTTGTVGAVGSVAIGSMVANVCMYVVHLVASAHFLDVSEYGEFAVLLSAMLVLGVPAMALQNVIAREVVLGGDEGRLRALGVVTTCWVVVLTVVATPLVALLLRTDVATTAAALASAPLLALIAAGQGILQGRGEFRALSWVLAVVGVARSIPIIGAFAAGAGPAGGLLAGTLGAAASAAVVWLVVWSMSRAGRPGRPSGAAGVLSVVRASQVQLVLIVASSIDLLLSPRVLDAEEVGVYALGAIATKVAFWLPQAIGVVFYPRLADPARSSASLRQAVTVVAGIGVVLTVLAGAAGPVVPFVFGDGYDALVPILWLFAYIGAALAVLQVVLLSAIARDRTRVALGTWLVVGAEVLVIVTLTGSVVGVAGTAAVAVTIAALGTWAVAR
ncbi:MULTISPECIES: polysaccharide biosynthesis protein [unclassified Gordonia (in: high G+C Gram-positive bacteria)]|uniref:polysaccharide biosynthesis protein n=1 Tax=unclassified Gordonia (in: high G+C Gram-positive bacteria) TaxID=2657482 RepID=UPI00071E06AF|nr:MULTISPECIES: polysaccharide biosynthesis protein [unclassified Gordonia (in: high G+C Gram-positive bacteria)]KSU57475.1 polysaccharide biosynthesis protein [Gordonia sp. SGD-V-85]SCC36300.1 Membrane protein involved in the export of O-antigen and teichoic acid [Gordonia sp. v-85]